MLVVIGGHSRNIGKTSVVCGVIRALPDWNWTAIKITPHGHGVTEENSADPSTDSGRFLAAGAARAFLVQTPAMPTVRCLLDRSDNAIIESNSILQFLMPDLCAMVLDSSVQDFKPSSLRFLDRVNALVVTGGGPLFWPEVPPALLGEKPRFTAPPPSYENAEFVDFIRANRHAALKTSSVSADYLPR